MIRPPSAVALAASPHPPVVTLETSHGNQAPGAASEVGQRRGDGKVEYLCVASGHLPRSLKPGVGLTLHLGGWAYCPAGESLDHHWFDTGGIEIDGLTRFVGRARTGDEPSRDG